MLTATSLQMPVMVANTPRMSKGGHYNAGPQFAPLTGLAPSAGHWILPPQAYAPAAFGTYAAVPHVMPAAVVQTMTAKTEAQLLSGSGFGASLHPCPSAPLLASPGGVLPNFNPAGAGGPKDVPQGVTAPTSQATLGSKGAIVTPVSSARSLSTCASTPPLPMTDAPHGPLVAMTPPMSAPGKEQESERMERLADGVAKFDPLTDGVQLVSLGCYCGPKLSFKKMGRGSETLPFDWMRTRLDGLLDFMRNDFHGFFTFCSQEPVPGSHMVVYRNFNHSFWHDDPTDTRMQEKYQRRFDRFQSIDAGSKPVLFVRVIATTDEIPRLTELTTELRNRFGSQACLLAIVSMQQSLSGSALVDNCPDLMLHYLPANAYGTAAENNEATYGRAIQDALDWIVNREVSVMQFPNLLAARAVANPSNVGDEAFGLKAFEGPAVASYCA
mmetsp:Transcript_2208/g.3766  ORF Transcript_2208/g.3766 Transcript_2208/m.3766 type:complete len:441 (+) Transcript_2208:68-1390(+)